MLYWRDGELVFENYALQKRVIAEPLVCVVLHICGQWRTLRQINSALTDCRRACVQKTLEQLCEDGVLDRSDRRGDARVEAVRSWAAWNPAAGLLHFSTKDTEFARDPREALEELKHRAKHHPMPLPIKRYVRTKRTVLPRIAVDGEFAEVLKSRRTWRKFGKEAVPLEKLTQVLELTFGIQGWVDVPGLGRAAMKTSPSGGSLHPVEAYVLAQKVKGLRNGFYHYSADRHELEWLREGVPRRDIERHLASQWWFARGGFLVLMTGVFARTQWKYDSPRTYRVVLAETGHLCQTFCLVATWLGLAPFCTMALRDTRWEKWLGIDGVRESILYIAGAGTKPGATDMRDAHIGMLARSGSA